jgi:hypothetical protein
MLAHYTSFAVLLEVQGKFQKILGNEMAVKGVASEALTKLLQAPRRL